MRLISFDPFRSTGIPDVTYIKPELIFREKDLIQNADWIIFPEYWQVNFLSYSWKKNIFPSISSYHLGHDKVEMTRAFQSTVPQHMPYTLITGKSPTSVEKILDEFTFPFIAKEIKNSMGKGVYLINNRKELNDYVNLNEVLYIQEYLPINRDIRLVYVGDRVVCSYWRVGQNSFKNNVAQGGIIDFSPVPQHVIELVEKTANELGINHAGFDVALVDDYPYFFEFNVFFGMQALANTEFSIGTLIYDYISKFNTPSPPKPLFPTRRVS